MFNGCCLLAFKEYYGHIGAVVSTVSFCEILAGTGTLLCGVYVFSMSA